MKRKLFLLALIILIASLLISNSALAQTGSGFDLNWNVIGGGGGTATGSGFSLSGTIGQSVVGSSSEANFSLGHGFWNQVLQIYAYLPMLSRDYMNYFEGPWEVEPNNTYQAANGPVYFGRDYYGYPGDQTDYFSFYMPSAGTVTIDLTNHTGQGVQLLLYYQIPIANGSVARAWQPPYHLSYTGQAGWYYIQIYTVSGFNTTNPYTLRVTWPSVGFDISDQQPQDTIPTAPPP